MNKFFLYLAFSFLCIVIPYTNNFTVLILALSCVSFYKKEALFLFFKDKIYGKLWVKGVLLLLTFSFISIIWGYNPLKGFTMSLEVLGIMLLGFLFIFIISYLNKKEMNKLINIILISSGLMLVFCIIDLVSGGIIASIFRPGHPEMNLLIKMARGLAVYILFTFPICWFIYKKTGKLVYSLIFLSLLGTIIFSLHMAALKLAFIFGILVFALSYYFGRKFIIFASSLMIIYSLSSVFISAYLFNQHTLEPYKEQVQKIPSWAHRVVIWEFASKKALEKLPLGYGMDTSRKIGEETSPRASKFFDNPLPLLPLHPHNSSLQLYLELGLIGILLFNLIIFGLIKDLLRIKDKINQAIGFNIISNAYLIMHISYGIWQTWFLSGLWLSGGIYLLMLRYSQEEK